MTRSCAMLLLAGSCACAHPALQTYVIIDASRGNEGGSIEIRVIHDVPAYALNSTSAEVLDWQMYELLEGPDDAIAAALTDARERFESGFWLLADGDRIDFQLVHAPALEHVQQWKLDNPSWRLPIAMPFVLEARIPDGTAELCVRSPHILDEVFVVFKLPDAEEQYLTVPVAEVSAGMDVSTVSQPLMPVATQSPASSAPPSAAPTIWLALVAVALVAAGAVLWARARRSPGV